MPGLNLRSIGRKLALAVGVPVLLTVLAGLALSWPRINALLRQHAAEEASALADLVATSFSLSDPDRPQPESAAQAHPLVEAAMTAQFQILETVQDLRVVDHDGVVRWSRRPEEQGTAFPDAQRLLAAPPQGHMNLGSGEYVRPVGGMVCARCHAENAFKVGAVQVVVARPRLAREVEGFFKATLLFVLILFAAMGLVTTAALRQMVAMPLWRLTEAMLRAEKGDFLVRAAVEGDDEIGRLAHAFNSMLSRITDLKVAEIETSRELEAMQRELALKAELERQHEVIEETNRALARRVREMSLLVDIAQSLNSTLELEEILKLVTEMVGVTMGVDQFAVMLLDEEKQSLRVAACFGYKFEELTDFRLPVGRGASGLAAQSREPVYLPDVTTDPRYVPGPQDPEGDASLLCVPMICKDTLVGVLSFVRFAKAAFNESDVMLLQLVASQAAMAIVNARLFTETVELTLIDALTGVFNRRHLFASLEMEVARAQRFDTPLSVLMIDIDHFKNFNDTCGHAAGDQILKGVAELLHRTVRKVDTVARYGGEEFMVLLPQIGRPEACEVAEKLRRAVAGAAFENAEKQPLGKVTISVGVATFPDDGATLTTLVDAADSALYASKRGGRDKVSAYARGMELHPGRERGPWAEKRKRDGEPDTGGGEAVG